MTDLRSSAPPATGPRHRDGRPGPRLPANPSATVAVALVVLLVLATAGIAIAHHRDARGPADGSGPGTSAAAGAGGGSPGTDPGLTGDGVLVDAFAQGPGLGAGPSGKPWTVVRGSWAVAGGIVSVSGGDGQGLNLATLAIGTDDVRAQVTLPTGTAGAALAFRVVDPGDYWLVASAPAGAPFSIVQVVDGHPALRGRTGGVTVGPGSTMGVEASGPTIHVYVNGRAMATVHDPHPRGDAIGLGTSLLETSALFAKLVYLPHG